MSKIDKRASDIELGDWIVGWGIVRHIHHRVTEGTIEFATQHLGTGSGFSISQESTLRVLA